MSYSALGTTSAELATATPEDARLAERASIPLDVLLAIRANESRGRVRAVRFEPHVFHRNTQNRYVREVPGSPSSVSHVASETNRAAFERARRYNEDAAIRSTSWGAYQVLGGKLLNLYPHNTVAAFDANPERVGREMLIEWFRTNPRAAAYARARNIPALARAYNGSVRWGERVSALLERIRREGVSLVRASRSAVPYVGAAVLAMGAAFAGWAYWRTR